MFETTPLKTTALELRDSKSAMGIFGGHCADTADELRKMMERRLQNKTFFSTILWT
jgi:hypothetical protein